MRLLPFVWGEPRPVMPLTLKRLVLSEVELPDVGSGRVDWGMGGGGGRLGVELEAMAADAGAAAALPFKLGSDCLPTSDGGVREPLVGAVPLLLWPPSLEVSVDCSVRKLALDFRRSCRRLKIEGAIVAGVVYCIGGGLGFLQFDV